MKILLAAGVFYPDVGGPAIHVRKIAERLVIEGFTPLVIAYGDDPHNEKFSFSVKRISRKYPKIFQWLMYFLLLCKEGIDSKLVYAFDPTAAGIPAALAAYVWNKPFIIRIGGDPIWEREAEKGKRLMPITDYYQKKLYKVDKPFLYILIQKVLKRANMIVVYNQFWVNFYNTYYGISLEKMRIVKNPIFRRETASRDLPQDPVILFAGRFVLYKNLSRILKVFDAVRRSIGKGRLLLIGGGPEKDTLLNLQKTLPSRNEIEFLESLPQQELFVKIKESALAIGPALSEFNPNFILEALSFGKPVLLSRNHGLSIELPEEFIFDPLNEEELKTKIEFIFDPVHYKNAVEKVASMEMNQTWEKVTDFHLNLIKELLT
jgi:glycosyltransferase involved in cell wall biosynthesis